MNTSGESNQAGPVLDRLNAAVRENPVAAGLIGAGIAWMFFGGGRRFGKAVGVVSAAAGQTGSAISSAGGALANSAAQAGASVKEAASTVMSSSASLVPDDPFPDTDKAWKGVGQVKSVLTDGMATAARSSREYGSVMQSKFSESMQQQPLLLGAIGLVLGAGIASTFATTEFEHKLMGEQSASTRETIKGFVEEAKERGTQVILK